MILRALRTWLIGAGDPVMGELRQDSYTLGYLAARKRLEEEKPTANEDDVARIRRYGEKARFMRRKQA